MRYLLAMSIGPVQDFIAASRRTADLTAGSSMLVNVVRETARALEEHLRPADGRLIFPADPMRPGANKLLAEVGDADPCFAAELACAAAQSALWAKWDAFVRSLSREQARHLVPGLAERDVADFLEVAAAWVEWDGTPEAYADCWKQVERLLAGRKTLREFRQPAVRIGQPKSPLDPSRDCAIVVTKGFKVPSDFEAAPFWLKKQEFLDAVSLLKRETGVRMAQAAEGVPSTSLMAVRALLPRISRSKKGREALGELERIVAPHVPRADLGDLFFPARAAEEGLDTEDVRAHRKIALAEVEETEAPPYYAVLHADGDRMGVLLQRQAMLGPDGHHSVYRALLSFEAEVDRLVKAHDGYLVYAGGDDVLALLPVTTALPCAYAVRQAFATCMEPLKPEAGQGTLSAGVVFVHHMESLQASLGHARAAERAAKQEAGRDALAVVYHPRSGGPTGVAQKWDYLDGLPGWNTWIERFAGHAKDGLSRGTPYELRALAGEFLRKADGTPSWVWEQLPPERREVRLRGEAGRILGRKMQKEVPDEGGETGRKLALPDEITSPESLSEFASQLILARFLADYRGAAQ